MNTDSDAFVTIELRSVSEALSSSIWKATMVKELQVLVKNDTWTLTYSHNDKIP